MNWDLFIILITILLSLAAILFTIYKVICFITKNKNGKDDELKKYNEEIIKVLTKIYDNKNQIDEKIVNIQKDLGKLK